MTAPSPFKPPEPTGAFKAFLVISAIAVGAVAVICAITGTQKPSPQELHDLQYPRPHQTVTLSGRNGPGWDR